MLQIPLCPTDFPVEAAKEDPLDEKSHKREDQKGSLFVASSSGSAERDWISTCIYKHPARAKELNLRKPAASKPASSIRALAR